MANPILPITETPNELTKDIDIADPIGIVRLLRQTDAQIFSGYSTYPGIYDRQILDKLEMIIQQTVSVLKHKGNRAILISGAGTSGRLAFFISRTFNQLLTQVGQPPLFHYLMAGGDKALIRAQEGAEDDPEQAVRDLKSKLDGVDRAIYVGVTCGLSAPYIAGQLNYLESQPQHFSVLLGFNPAESARNVPIENWAQTFLDIVHKLENSKTSVILNPIVGPEPITGSTRMKSGTATKLLLELIFAIALTESGLIKDDEYKKRSIPEKIWQYLQRYESTRIATYRELDSIGALINLAGNALRHRRHIYYLGTGAHGILGIIDASECPPTFGAEFDDVRGFISQGWNSMLGPGKDLSSTGSQYRIGIDEFETVKLPKLGNHDLVLFLGEKNIPNSFRHLLEKSKECGASTGAVIVNGKSKITNKIDVLIQPILPELTLLGAHSAFAELAMKLILNAISTGAHILAGKVYHNRMVDLKISNNKLYYRTVNIISDIIQVNKQVATESMLKAIYETDRITQAQLTRPISAHIAAATGKTKIVPKAMLLATGKFNLRKATEALEKEPIIRNIITQISQKPS